MRRRGVIVLMAAALLGLGGRAGAAVTEGSLLTNLASATYRTTSGAPQTISYGATSFVLVATPCIMLNKVASPTVQSSGGLVTFCITFSNCSAYASAMNVYIRDVLPVNTLYYAAPVMENPPPGSAGLVEAYSTNGTSWTASYPPNGQPGPLYLRWTVDLVGPKQSGLVCFQARVL